MKLQDSVCLITGGSRGLGREIAELYAARGARLILVARGTYALAEAQRQLSERTEVLAIAADVGEHAEDIVRQSLERFGRIDVLINNASTIGSSPMPPLRDLPWQALERVLHTNVAAPLHLTQLVLPSMLARRHGAIINVTSDAAVEAYPGWGAYGTSKAALEHMSRILAAELKDSGVRVFLVDPGDMNTDMHRQAEPQRDLSELPHPRVSAPLFVRLVEGEAGGGRHLAQALQEAVS